MNDEVKPVLVSVSNDLGMPDFRPEMEQNHHALRAQAGS